MFHNRRQIIAADLAGRRHVIDQPVHRFAAALGVKHPLAAVDTIGMIAHHPFVNLTDFFLAQFVALFLSQLGVDGENRSAAADDLTHPFDQDNLCPRFPAGQGTAQTAEAAAHDNDITLDSFFDLILWNRLRSRFPGELTGSGRRFRTWR